MGDAVARRSERTSGGFRLVAKLSQEKRVRTGSLRPRAASARGKIQLRYHTTIPGRPHLRASAPPTAPDAPAVERYSGNVQRAPRRARDAEAVLAEAPEDSSLRS